MDSKDLTPDMDTLVLRYLESGREDLKDLIVVQCGGMVERLARKFAGIEAYEDLVQVGFIGLLNALSKFDPKAGVKFNTYASYLIAGEIKHYLRDRSQTIRQPAWLQELRHKVNKAAAALQSDLSRPPTEREIAEKLAISETAVREVIQTQELLRVTSLDASANGDEDADTEVEKLDAGDFCPEQLSVEDRLVLEGALRQLRDLERQVLVAFHFDMLSQTEIAANLGISCNYVSHILRQSVAKLRKILVKEDERDRILRRQTSSVNYEVLDELTGAYSDSFFRARLEEEVHRASCQNSAVGLVVLQFSGLETLQKFYGASSVDGFLADAADFCRETIRRLDLVCRYGETGFAIIVLGSADHVPLACSRVLKKLSDWTGSRCSNGSPITVQLGCSMAPSETTNAKEMIQRASGGGSGQKAA